MRLKAAYRKLSSQQSNRTRLGIACCALVMACSFAPSSMAATTYDITFSTAYGPAPTSGSFTYDSTSHTFSNFDVVFGGATYDLTSAANAPSINPPIPGSCSGVSGGLVAFMILDAECTDTSTASWEVGDQDSPAGSFVFVDYFNAGGNENAYISGTPPVGAISTNQNSEGGWSISQAVTPSTTVPEPASLPLLFTNLAVVSLLASVRHIWKLSARRT